MENFEQSASLSPLHFPVQGKETHVLSHDINLCAGLPHPCEAQLEESLESYEAFQDFFEGNGLPGLRLSVR